MHANNTTVFMANRKENGNGYSPTFCFVITDGSGQKLDPQVK
jgi:hypothetical protein